MARVEALYRPSDIASGATQEQRDRGWNGLIKAILIQHREKTYVPGRQNSQYDTVDAVDHVLAADPNALPGIFAECLTRIGTSLEVLDNRMGIEGGWEKLLPLYTSSMIVEDLFYEKYPELAQIDNGREYASEYGHSYLEENLADKIEKEYGIPPLVKK